jgi:biopolymer transport protein ExbB
MSFSVFIYGQASVTEEELSEEARKGMTITQFFIAGGIAMWPLLLCSILVLTFGIYFAFSLREKKLFPDVLWSNITKALSEGDIGKALEYCKRHQGRLTPIYTVMIEESIKNQPIEKIREAGERKGALVIGDINRNIEYLNTIGVIAPMLGLFGTVTGMMKAFSVVAYKAGLGNPRLLAAGIWEAFITTATGLPIGIVAFVLYIYFREKMGRVAIIAADKGEELINLIEKARGGK